MITLTKEEFYSKSRYLYEIAQYLSVDKRTLKVWLEDIEGITLKDNRRLFSPHDVRIIIEHFC